MGSDKINPVLFLVIIGTVFAVEMMLQNVSLSPLLQTGTARCIEIVLIFFTLTCFSKELSAIGLSADRIKTGFKKGLIWSAGFGMLAAILGAVLLLSGTNPFNLLYVRLPESVSDIVLFYFIGGLLAPVAEEIFFRGVVYGFVRDQLYGKIKKWAIPAALVASTYFFITAHQTGGGIPLPQLVGGIVFCASYEIEKSLITPIVIHSLGNLVLFTISFF